MAISLLASDWPGAIPCADVPILAWVQAIIFADTGDRASTENIAEYHQARTSQGGSALAAITVDGDIDTSVRARLLSTTDVRSVTVINFDEGTEAGASGASA